MSARTALASAAALGVLLGGISAHASSFIQLPNVALPSASGAPRLLVRADNLETLRARRTNAAYAPYYTRFKQTVDSALNTADFATLGDDRLAKVAKGAALLDPLGDSPPGTRFTRYRDVAVLALKSMGGRDGTGIFGGGNLNALEDSGRLQSMAEAFDMLRGTGVSASDDTALRAKIADWAGAYMDDAQLPFQVNNWQVKSGSALVTAALALADHTSAGEWLSRGQAWVNDALAKMANDSGYFREGVHYRNYSLNNLASAAYHVRNAAGIDWFTPLKPIVRFAIDTRLPDGRNAPFEEGLANVLPFHVLWGAYASDPIAAEMVWAWRGSGKDTVNYENQQLHDATVFVFMDTSVGDGAAPQGSPTRFYAGETHTSVLRDRFAADGRTAILFAGLDYAATEFLTSRHNTRNPLDLVLSGAGANLLVTSGGGPEVTRSTNRDYYLSPASKNLPLVGGTAPFLMNANDVATEARVDSHAASGAPGFCDLATSVVRVYAGASRVARTLAMVGGEYFVVLDAVTAPNPADVSIPWHVRGTRGNVSASGNPLRATWTFMSAALDLASAVVPAAQLTATSGYYADTWAHEEAISGVRADTRGAEVRALTFLDTRASSAAPRAVTDASSGDTVALRVESGATRDLVAASRTASIGAGSLAANGSLALVRETSGDISAFALSAGTSLQSGGRALVSASAAVTLVAEIAAGDVRVVVSRDPPSSAVTLSLFDLPGVTLDRAHGATFEGSALDASRFEQTARGFVVTVPGGGTLRISPSLPAPDGGVTRDGGAVDGGAVMSDAGLGDAGAADAGVADGGLADAGAGPDGGATSDAGASVDAGTSEDAGPPTDAGVGRDAGTDPTDGGTRSEPPPTAPRSGCAVMRGAGDSLALLSWFAASLFIARRRRR